MEEIKLQDGQLRCLPQLMFLVEDENRQQIQKWGIQSHEPFKWVCILGEEVGELNKAILEHSCNNSSRTRVAEEAIQVATLALKIAEMYLSNPKGNSKSNLVISRNSHPKESLTDEEVLK